MFCGEYHLVLDEKNRFVMPRAFATQFNSEVVFFTRLKDFIIINSRENFEKMADAFLANEVGKRRRDIARYIYPWTMEEKISKDRRVAVPEYIKESLNIGRNISLVGMKGAVELWDANTYQEYMKCSEVDYLKRLRNYIASLEEEITLKLKGELV